MKEKNLKTLGSVGILGVLSITSLSVMAKEGLKTSTILKSNNRFDVEEIKADYVCRGIDKLEKMA